MHDFGIRSGEIFSKFELSDDMFYRKGQGVPGFIRSMVSGIVKRPNSWVREITNDPPRWSTGTASKQLQAAINNGLETTLKEAIHYYDDYIVEYKS